MTPTALRSSLSTLLCLLPAAAFAQTTTPVFSPGNLVVAVEGCGVHNATCTITNGTGTNSGNATAGGYGDNQAGPFTLFQFTPTGTTSAAYVNSVVLPQAPSGANLPVSGEYGSSSEGTLQLSGAGQYLTVGAYGINAATFDASPTTYGAAPSNALAQSGSLTGQSYTPIARVVSLIDPYGNVNSSSALFNIYNTNNPRSTFTADGLSVYISGQGSGTDATGGVFYTPLFKTNNAPTAITGLDTTTNTVSQDTRDVQIYNGTLYISVDSKGGTGSTRSFLGTLGTPPATSLYNSNAGPTQLPFYNNAATPVAVTSNGKLTLTASETNGLNASGQQINLSASSYFFANPSTLYIADTGNSKQTSASNTLGDGGLQKWVNTKADGTGNWQLLYTLAAGLHLIANPTNTPANTSGTTGLYAVTGRVVGTSVYLYATNATIADLDFTYLYGITDTLAATTNPGTSFTLLATAPQDSNFKGVAFAPTLPTGSTTITTVPSGLVITTAGTGCVPGTYPTPVTLIWTPGSACTITTALQQTSNTTPYYLTQWQDGTTSTTYNVTATSTAAVYNATFTTTDQPVGVLEKVYDNTTNSTTVQQSDSLLVSGWVADPKDGSPLANVKVYIDGAYFATPTLNIARPDVATAYNAAYANSGYQLIASAAALTPGTHAVTVIAIDTAGNSTTFGPATINVTAASQLAFTAAPATPITAGSYAGVIRVALENASGAVTTTSSGIVTLTVTGPGTYTQTYTAATASGVATFDLSASPALTAAGAYTYTAASPGITSAAAPETVTAGPLAALILTGLTTQTQPGVPQTLTVNATDTYANPVTTFTGTVTFTSSDPVATLPAPYTFTATDAGTHAFPVTLNTGGTLSVTATSGTITGVQSNILIRDAIWLLNRTDSLVRLTDAAVQTTTAGSTSGASTAGALAFDNAGNVWATQSNTSSFIRYSPTGTLQFSASSIGGLNAPVALALDGSGQAWFANQGNGSISVISPTGAAVTPSTGYQPATLSAPTGLIIDSSGSVWITNSSANTITKLIGAAPPVVTPTAAATTNNTLATRP